MDMQEQCAARIYRSVPKVFLTQICCDLTYSSPILFWVGQPKELLSNLKQILLIRQAEVEAMLNTVLVLIKLT